jgi:hypothetical protein
LLDSLYGLVALLPANSVQVEYEFRTPIALPEGEYKILIVLDQFNDPTPDNNIGIAFFTVKPSMSGNYTIPGNFPSIESAIETVFARGVSPEGVTFVLTEPIYNIGDIASPYALEITTSISGFPEEGRIRFIPSQERSMIRGGVTINLTSSTGIGLFFGSAITSPYADAPINKLSQSD